MKNLILTPATLVWFIITGATAFSWSLAMGMPVEQSDSNMWTTITLMVIAFVKVRLVIMWFMEVRTAPLPLRIIGEAWTLAACTAVLVLYWTSQH